MSTTYLLNSQSCIYEAFVYKNAQNTNSAKDLYKLFKLTGNWNGGVKFEIYFVPF